jgi:hypothetical protein
MHMMKYFCTYRNRIVRLEEINKLELSRYMHSFIKGIIIEVYLNYDLLKNIN